MLSKMQNLEHLSPEQKLQMIRALKKKTEELGGITNRSFREFQKAYSGRVRAFAESVIRWPGNSGPTDYQAEILEALFDPKNSRAQVAVRSSRGAGKTTIAAIAVLYFALMHDGVVDWKVLTTASVWRQLQHFLWPEIRTFARRIKWDIVGREPFNERTELLNMALQLSTGEAFAAASNNQDAMEGAHATALLVILDESKAIPDEIFDSIQGTLSGANQESRILAISTPGMPRGWFYRVFMEGLHWYTRHVTIEEAIDAGRVSGQWVEERRIKWGEDSPLYKTHVLGEFAADQESGVIPLSWVEEAVRRGERADDDEYLVVTALGADVSLGGAENDAAPIAVIANGTRVIEIIEHTISDPRIGTMEMAGVLARLFAEYNCDVIVDAIGLGAGVVQRLREQGIPAIPFVASKKTGLTDSSGELRFLNWRAAGWWMLREMLDPANAKRFNVTLPNDDELIGELILPKYRITSAGNIQIESKDSLRRRNAGRSTDKADAVIMGLVGPTLAIESTYLGAEAYESYR